MSAHATTLVRHRLQVHGRGVLGVRLTVVVGPPGIGKSVVLGHWLDDLATAADVLRINFRPEHDSPDGFRAEVATRATALFPSLEWHSGQDFTPDDLSTFVAAVHERPGDKPLVVALDSLDTLVDPTIVATISTAMSLLPPHVHFILASRTAPNMLLSELRAQGAVVDVGAHDLAFTREEVGELSALRGSRMLSSELDALAEATAGWAVAVSLGLSGASGARAMREYIDDVVLAGLPALEREFLEEVAVLPHVTSESADHVRGTSDAEERMRMLVRLGRFPGHDATEHADVFLPTIFRDHLCRRVGARHPQRLTVLRRRAAAHTGAITPLSARELEVLALLATDLTAEGIAEELVLSFHTVKSHMRSIYSKLGVSSRTMAVLRATELGLVPA